MKRWTLLAGAVLLAACSTPPSPPAQQAIKSPAPPVRDLVAQVRAAAEADDALAVSPLRDPQIEDLRAEAERLERDGKYRQAAAVLARALETVPDDPELLQHAAELAIYRKAWTEAVELASRSYHLGPRLGPLCRRNWTALRVIYELHAQDEHAALAREKLAQCTVEPPVRM
ncbi:MAG: tetratricopeptide repeat protein [Rehaibacterium terrae]|uniref:tetratricopeptide repeat protein n=1 Tax=Rehaibacterium terrae TaxID=1341696 RepID=UPI0039192B00